MLTFARVRALAIVALLLAGALVAVYLAVSRDTTGAAATEGEGCPEGSIIADLALPDIRNVKINVYNGTNQTGLAAQLAEDFANRDFEVVEQGDDPLASEVEGVAVLRYGPQAVGASYVLQAYFLNDAQTDFDIEREDETVDVVVGSQFRQLATETEVKQSIAARATELGDPEPPPGTCAG
jgi:hypothetical protein